MMTLPPPPSMPIVPNHLEDSERIESLVVYVEELWRWQRVMHPWLRLVQTLLNDALRQAENVTVANLTSTGDVAHQGTKIGFYGATAGTKPTVSGIRDSNAALADLLTKLETSGLLVDSTTAT